MKIYKFRDLRQEYTQNHFFHILKENMVWCAAPSSLNDISEFSFSMDYTPSQKTASLLAAMMQKHGKLNFPTYMSASYAVLKNKIEEFAKPEVYKIIDKCRETIGVTSFSLSGTDPWLWETYGGQGFGAVVEFEIQESDIGNIYHLVDYTKENIFHVDMFLESALNNTEKIFRKILCTKTLKWKQEKEIRFLGKTPNINIKLNTPITAVIIGEKVSEQLTKKIENCCVEKDVNIYVQN